MHKISKKFSFDASHVLANHTGQCGRLHGHSYEIEVTMWSTAIDLHTHMVMDYADLDAIVKPFITMLDHQHLNCYILYPTAENIAVWFARKVLKALPVKLVYNELEVSVSETLKTKSTFIASHVPDTWPDAPPSKGLFLPSVETYQGSQDVSVEQREKLQKQIQGLWVVDNSNYKKEQR